MDGLVIQVTGGDALFAAHDPRMFTSNPLDMSNNGTSFFDLGKGSRDDENRSYPEDDPANFVNLEIKRLDGTTGSLRIFKGAELHVLLSQLEKKHNPKGTDFIIKREVGGKLEDVNMEEESSTLTNLKITADVLVVMQPED